MKRLLATVTAVTVLVGPMATVADGCPWQSFKRYRPSPTVPLFIQEDDPRWDCRTMGNRICGPGR